MRSYGQYCGLAKALDAVGDRWSLLIVRELLIRGECRYTDLRAGLPGVATNLLASRVRDLEEAGVIRRDEREARFELTERGRALEAAIRELGKWGAPLLAEAPKSDAFQGHWLALPIREMVRDHNPAAPPIEIEVRSGDETVVIEACGEIRTRVGKAARPAARISGPPRAVLGLLGGRLRLAQARAAGLKVEGDAAALRRVLAKALD